MYAVLVSGLKVWRDSRKEWNILSEKVRRKVVATDSECMIAVYSLGKGARVPMHNHPEKQMGIIIEGRGVFRTKNGEAILEKGDSYILEPNEHHEFEALEDSIVIDLFLPARSDFKEEMKEPDLRL